MYQKNLSVADWIKKTILCGVLAMVLSVVLCMLCSILIMNEVLGQGSVKALAIIISFLSSFMGCLCSAKSVGEKCIPSAMISASTYLVLALMIKGLFFRGAFGQSVYILPAVIIAAVVAGLLGARRKKRHR